MSYIRALSNPEALYIWGDGRGVAITVRDKRNNGSILYMPTTTFHGIMSRWGSGRAVDDENITYRGARMRMNIHGELRYILTYNKWYVGQQVSAHEVTWMYVYTQNKFRWARKKKLTKR